MRPGGGDHVEAAVLNKGRLPGAASRRRRLAESGGAGPPERRPRTARPGSSGLRPVCPALKGSPEGTVKALLWTPVPAPAKCRRCTASRVFSFPNVQAGAGEAPAKWIAEICGRCVSHRDLVPQRQLNAQARYVTY